MNGISKGKIYSFKGKEGIIKGIFEGKVISYNPKTIVQLRDVEKEGVLYNVNMDILKD